MRLPLLLSAALLSSIPSTAAFRTVPAAAPARARTALAVAPGGDRAPHTGKELLLPDSPRTRELLSRLTTSQLSALTELKKDERSRRGRFNKARLIKMGVTFASLLAAKVPTAAHAATPLVVTRGAITPLISAPGLGIVAMPGMKASPYAVGGLPNRGAWLFALALFVTTAPIRASGDGYGKMVHFVAKHLLRREEEEELEMGLAKETDWGAYAREEVGPLRKGGVEGSRYEVDPRTMLFNPIKPMVEVDRDVELAKLEQGSRYFRDRQYKQHHHPVRVSRAEAEEVSYLDALPINEESRHDVPVKYLDTLSAEASTWDAYGRRLEGARPVGEVEELKDEVSNLQTLMQIEQSMYQASNRALKSVVDAQAEDLHRSSSDGELREFDERMTTADELRAFDEKAREYGEAVGAEVSKEEGSALSS